MTSSGTISLPVQLVIGGSLDMPCDGWLRAGLQLVILARALGITYSAAFLFIYFLYFIKFVICHGYECKCIQTKYEKIKS